MGIVGIPANEQQEVWRLIAGILHLGNLTFKAKGKKKSGKY
jgi:myosin heavy subunit